VPTRPGGQFIHAHRMPNLFALTRLGLKWFGLAMKETFAKRSS
jgi:hypothetical protein